MFLDLRAPVSSLPLVGPAYVKKLEKVGITTLYDLLAYFPFRHIDSSLTATIASLQPGEIVTLQGMVLSIKTNYTHSGKTIQKALFSDGTGTLPLVWFNQPYLVQTLQKQPRISISGTVKSFNSKLSIVAPQFEALKNIIESAQNTVHTGRLVPVYSETLGLSSKWIRSRMFALLQKLPQQPEWLPQEIIQTYNLISYDYAVRQIHFPDSYDALMAAKHRLSFDELLLWQILAQIRKRERVGHVNSYRPTAIEQSITEVIDRLPYRLTGAQQRVIQEITADLNGSTLMNRLVQGDVGSGKTIVAATIMHAMYKSGYRSVLMAPTELLAHQHLQTITAILEPLGINVAGATKTFKNELTRADVVVGTHAVLFRELPKDVGLVVIDEQHRFGVAQRGKLLHQPKPPHLLSMTATPIPRTIALTLYAELDVSLIDEMPLGRKAIKTRVVTEDKRQAAYDWIRTRISAGEQLYIVCPLIESSEAEGFSEIKAAETEYERLHKEVFPDLRLGLVHGQMKAKDKDAVIRDFKDKKLDVLVATPVIEVGIDIPNATIMMIEGAERFGLAQLHQLRGRVGRGEQQSYCLLLPTNQTEHALKRLNYLESTHSGFELANIDLKLRGPGDIYGTRQSGFIDLKIATLEDEPTIQATHQAAADIIRLDLTLQYHALIKDKVTRLVTSLAAPN